MVRLLEEGRDPSLGDLGGIEAVAPYAGRLRRSPLLGEFVRAAVKETAGERASAGISEFVAALIDGLEDEFAIPEIVDLLDEANWMDATCAARCFNSFRTVAFDRRVSAISRAFALDGAFRIGLSSAAARYELLGTLLRIDVADDPIFLSRALKMLGVAYASERSPDLLERIFAIYDVEAIRAEAAFEIGLAKLADAFDAENRRDALLAFGDATHWFGKADNGWNPEAKLYADSLRILLAFSDAKDPTAVAEMAREIGECSTALYAWHFDDSDPRWLGARRFQTACWARFARELHGLAEDLESDLWLEPVVTIERNVLPIYVASRTVFKRTADGGIEEVLRPRIEASMSTERVRAVALRYWLSKHAEHDWRDAAEELSERVIALVGDEETLPPDQAATKRPTVVALTLGSDLPPDAKSRVARALEESVELQLAGMKAAEFEIVDRCIGLVEDHPDYSLNSEVRALFDSILLFSVRFLANRLDLTAKTVPALDYLFYQGTGARPTESTLQTDYFQAVSQSLLNVRVEVSDVASGRADVYFPLGPDHLVCEVKREEKDASFDNLRVAYLEQSVSYQATSYRLGFMLVLDQTNEGADMTPHLSELVRVENYLRRGESKPRVCVVFKVPGRKVRPSDLTKRAKIPAA